MSTLIATADGLRRHMFRWGAKTALGRACARDRGVRVATLVVAHVVVSFGLTVIAPLWMLLLSPLLLGVPHIAGDLRYLGLARYGGLGRRGLLWVGVPLLALTVGRVCAVAEVASFPSLEIVAGTAAVLGGIWLAVGSPERRLIIAGGALLLAGVALDRPFRAALVLGHAHNAIGIALWAAAAWQRGHRGAVLACLALCVGGVYALAAGVVVPMTIAAPVDGFGFGEMVAALAPDMSLEWSVGLVLSFAFLQGVHYAVWLRFVPGSVHKGAVAPTIRRSLKRLERDFGRSGVRLLFVSCVALPVIALTDPVRVREVYLSLVLFHGWLELAVVGHRLSGGVGKRTHA